MSFFLNNNLPAFQVCLFHAILASKWISKLPVTAHPCFRISLQSTYVSLPPEPVKEIIQYFYFLLK